MCRLFAITSETPVSPMVTLEALDVMREGHDGSGVGLFLRDLGGPFEDMKDAPILSGIFSEAGIRRLDIFMMAVQNGCGRQIVGFRMGHAYFSCMIHDIFISERMTCVKNYLGLVVQHDAPGLIFLDIRADFFLDTL